MNKMLTVRQKALKYKRDLDFHVGFVGDAVCCVKANDYVNRTTALFDGKISECVQSLNICKELAIPREKAADYLVKSDGEIVEKGEVIAVRPLDMGLTERIVRAGEDGRISLRKIESGIIEIMSPFMEGVLTAGVEGRVRHIVPATSDKREIVISVPGYVYNPAIVMKCVNGGVSGVVDLIKSGNSVYRPSDVDSSLKNKIVVVGRLLTFQLYEALVEVNAKGVIAGGIQLAEYKSFGETAIPVFVTEGWGSIPISPILMDVLQRGSGNMAYMDMERSRLIVCPKDISKDEKADGLDACSVEEIKKGQIVKIIDSPCFGYSAKVVGVLEDEELVKVETESRRELVLSPRNLIIVS